MLRLYSDPEARELKEALGRVLREAARHYGNQCVVLSVDAKLAGRYVIEHKVKQEKMASDQAEAYRLSCKTASQHHMCRDAVFF